MFAHKLGIGTRVENQQTEGSGRKETSSCPAEKQTPHCSTAFIFCQSFFLPHLKALGFFCLSWMHAYKFHFNFFCCFLDLLKTFLLWTTITVRHKLAERKQMKNNNSI